MDRPDYRMPLAPLFSTVADAQKENTSDIRALCLPTAMCPSAGHQPLDTTELRSASATAHAAYTSHNNTLLDDWPKLECTEPSHVAFRRITHHTDFSIQPAKPCNIKDRMARQGQCSGQFNNNLVVYNAAR